MTGAFLAWFFRFAAIGLGADAESAGAGRGAEILGEDMLRLAF
jgi:hypothetical protein